MRFLLSLGLRLSAVSALLCCALAVAQESFSALVLAPASTGIERYREGFSEGCEALRYNVAVSYPGSSVVSFISTRLQFQRWTPSSKQEKWNSPVGNPQDF